MVLLLAFLFFFCSFGLTQKNQKVKAPPFLGLGLGGQERPTGGEGLDLLVLFYSREKNNKI